VIYATGRAAATVPARTGLVGNPSDAFGGAVVGLALDDLTATVVAEPALGVSLEAEGSALTAERIGAVDGMSHPGNGPLSLLWAATSRYARSRAQLDGAGVRLSLDRTEIPPGVGLAGSSAIVIAALRALGALFGDEVPQEDLPSLALSCERDDLGIAAGLGDRVVQTYGGLVYLDLGRSRRSKVEPLDASRLPDLFVAWRPGTESDSGEVHGGMRERFARGETLVVETMRELAGLARAALRPLLSGDAGGLGVLMERNLELRRELYELDPRHLEMAEAAAELGSPVNYTGSGGAIVGLLRDGDQLADLRLALERLGCELAVRRRG
jgi:glucuronokinase